MKLVLTSGLLLLAGASLVKRTRRCASVDATLDLSLHLSVQPPSLANGRLR